MLSRTASDVSKDAQDRINNTGKYFSSIRREI
jgi:hypothetical protein